MTRKIYQAILCGITIFMFENPNVDTLNPLTEVQDICISNNVSAQKCYNIFLHTAVTNTIVISAASMI